MKKNRKISPFLSGLLIFILVVMLLVAPAAQAKELGVRPNPNSPETAEQQAAQVYNPALFTSTWGISPDMLINCDPGGNLLTKVSPGSAKSFTGLQASACKAQARIEQSSKSSSGPSSRAGCGSFGGFNNYQSSGVSGEPTMMKIAPVFTETRIVYLQCGKKVGVIGPPTCSCAGGYRYTYSCNKPKTVYVTIPCH